jgi:peptidoglycan hydrolase-like protein with peptidoglycan-binding domain
MSGTISPWPVAQNGNQGHPIRTLQSLLRARGHHVAVDGIFGSQTESAVRAFQTGKGLVANGIVNPQTWAALIAQVKRGSSGDAVRGVQEEFRLRWRALRSLEWRRRAMAEPILRIVSTANS